VRQLGFPRRSVVKANKSGVVRLDSVSELCSASALFCPCLMTSYRCCRDVALHALSICRNRAHSDSIGISFRMCSVNSAWRWRATANVAGTTAARWASGAGRLDDSMGGDGHLIVLSLLAAARNADIFRARAFCRRLCTVARFHAVCARARDAPFSCLVKGGRKAEGRRRSVG